jgi:cell division protein FtsZ
MAFITAGMGGGTGTGGAPVIAKACREKGILTVGVVTKPFHFEGSHRMKQADKGIEEMQQYVDTLIVIPNQNLFRIANEKTTFSDAFKMADSVLQSGVRGVTDLMVRPGLVNLDFADIRTAMLEMGKAMMGTGEASGDKRAVEAAEAAINNPLLDDVSMKGARGVIINVTGGYDMTLFEADEACNRIRDEVDSDANIIFGATFDEDMEGRMRVSIVATGIEREAEAKKKSGSGFKSTDAVATKTLERAVPNTAPPLVQQQPAVQHRAPAERAISALAGVEVAAPRVAPVVTAPPAATLAAPAPPEPETDMFEQSEFTGDAAAQNTALRGTRYKDSFIPPKPAEVGRATVAGPQMSSFHGSHTVQSSPLPPISAQPRTLGTPYPGSGQGLHLNPPKLPLNVQRKVTPSLFERITGSVQQHLEGLRETTEHVLHAPRAGSAPQQHSPLLQQPAQGSLNIDAPAAAPEAKQDGELDIPAFLRRQAN